ncbi:hypothetical protein FACS189499_07480 [Clostridia bacterium]|nr:hypothetical protein FACS189499_07480 [Clostridia bacterium]
MISENSKSNFNPMEMKIITDDERKILKSHGKEVDETDPVKAKLDFMLSFFNTIMGHIKITAEQRRIIDICLKEAYADLVNEKTQNAHACRVF